MGKACDWVKKQARDLFHWVYPEAIVLPDCVRKMLERLYPTVDWNTVTFHDGMPWIIGAGDQAGIALPRTYDLHHIDIYLHKGSWDPCSCAGLALVVHESLHALQYRDILGGWGIGFARPFIVAYLSCWSGTGGDSTGNALEKPAYDQEDLFRNCCGGIAPLKICDCASTPPAYSAPALDALVAKCPDVVKTSSGVQFWKMLWDCVPGLRWLWRKAKSLVSWGCSSRRQRDGLPWWKYLLCPFAFLGALAMWLAGGIWFAIWVVLWSIIALGLALLKLLVELLLLVIDGFLWAIAGIVCAAVWVWEKLKQLWHWLKNQLAKACNWATMLEKTCARWETTREQKCTETRDQGYNKCTQQEDQGYSQCAQEEDQGYNECCDWWPCSWACKAWVWVSNIVCVAWTWVSHMVCVAWTWVSNIVCVAWTWIVSKTCKAFTWVVKKLTCW